MSAFKGAVVSLATLSLAGAVSMIGTVTAQASTPAPGTLTLQQPPPGELQCCYAVLPASNPTVSVLAGLLGIKIPPNTLVGVNCTPITPGGVNSCAEQPVVCTNNSFNGLIALNCTPYNYTVYARRP